MVQSRAITATTTSAGYGISITFNKPHSCSWASKATLTGTRGMSNLTITVSSRAIVRLLNHLGFLGSV